MWLITAIYFYTYVNQTSKPGYPLLPKLIPHSFHLPKVFSIS